ncbi:MAG: dihydroorotate dehydrogenase [Clostridiales bacterium]|nr:dihydroorotate dehydrogenase [Clostridiales bacterium]
MHRPVDLSVSLAGVPLKNPVVAASGTFGFGREYGAFFDLSELGAICVKGLTPLRREGNPPPRIAETPMGILNSVGLQNPGVDSFIAHELPRLREYDLKVIANISGETPEDYGAMCETLSDAGVDMIELNVSCPNVKAGGLAYGTRPELAAEVTALAKAHASVPVMVKLSPNVTDIAEIARAVEGAGADAISLINTLLGMRIDVATGRPVLRQNVGGLSGPAILPVAVRMVWQVANAVKLPILGMGGVASGQDAAELMLAGAAAVAVGTACFSDPYAPLHIRDELAAVAAQRGHARVAQLTGQVIPW